MTTERMNAYEMYTEMQQLIDVDHKVVQMYGRIKRDIADRKKRAFDNWQNITSENIDNYSVCGIYIPVSSDYEKRLIDMLKEDGFNVVFENTQDDINGTSVNVYTVSWGSDIPAIQYALDGPKYNENIIS
uniref:Uncharacterized protein n=1 Tax=viral metagenome TaxID=1070528 RepID=A0A6C0JWH9_9ZZZZ